MLVFADAMRRDSHSYQSNRQSISHGFRQALCLRQSFHFALVTTTVAVALRWRTLRDIWTRRHHRRYHHLPVLNAARECRAIIVAHPHLADLVELVVDDALGFHALTATFARYRLQLVALF